MSWTVALNEAPNEVDIGIEQVDHWSGIMPSMCSTLASKDATNEMTINTK
jgi:hypothetical protein